MLEVIIAESLSTKYITIESLKNLGHEIPYHCSSTKNILESYKMFKPDLLIMDLALGADEVCKAVSEVINYDVFANILILNSGSDQDSLIDAINLGAIDYLTKPLKINHLNEKISTIFGSCISAKEANYIVMDNTSLKNKLNYI